MTSKTNTLLVHFERTAEYCPAPLKTSVQMCTTPLFSDELYELLIGGEMTHGLPQYSEYKTFNEYLEPLSRLKEIPETLDQKAFGDAIHSEAAKKNESRWREFIE